MTIKINGNCLRLLFNNNQVWAITRLALFDAAFKPILVTDDDGNEYNVIPSDQFK